MKPLRLALHDLKTALYLFILLSLLTGIMYPFLVTAFAQILFPHQANGSLIVKRNIVIGSQLIGQSFSNPKYFWGRPSATQPIPYNGARSSGSNQGPTNPKWIQQVKQRLQTLQQFSDRNWPIPIDLVTASASGLDSEISPWAAFFQAPRVASARNLSEDSVVHLIQSHIQSRTLGFLGEPRVNVLHLNLALDELEAHHG